MIKKAACDYIKKKKKKKSIQICIKILEKRKLKETFKPHYIE